MLLKENQETLLLFFAHGKGRSWPGPVAVRTIAFLKSQCWICLLHRDCLTHLNSMWALAYMLKTMSDSVYGKDFGHSITVLSRTEDFTHLQIQCSGFSQALQQVQIHTTGTKKWECPVCQEDENNSGEVKAVTQWGKGLKWCLGSRRHCCCWLRHSVPHSPWYPVTSQQGQDALVISLFLWGDKAWSFPFLSASVCNNFAGTPPVGIYDYLIHICLCDDLVEIKGELMLGFRNFQAGNS